MQGPFVRQLVSFYPCMRVMLDINLILIALSLRCYR